jgi:signal transduction histidine kinase
VRELAERLGGQLSVRSAAAEGSTYVLEIPEG